MLSVNCTMVPLCVYFILNYKFFLLFVLPRLTVAWPYCSMTKKNSQEIITTSDYSVPSSKWVSELCWAITAHDMLTLSCSACVRHHSRTCVGTNDTIHSHHTIGIIPYRAIDEYHSPPGRPRQTGSSVYTPTVLTCVLC